MFVKLFLVRKLDSNGEQVTHQQVIGVLLLLFNSIRDCGHSPS